MLRAVHGLEPQHHPVGSTVPHWSTPTCVPWNHKIGHHQDQHGSSTGMRNISCSVYIFIHILITNPVRHADYLNCITDFTDWCTANFLSLNVSKTKELIFDFQRSQCPVQPVTIGTDTVEIVNEYKYLGTIIDNQLNWSSNIRQLYSKCQQRLYFLRKLNEFHIDHTIMHLFYTSVIQSIFAFCILVYYGNASSRDIHKVHRIIRQAQKFQLSVPMSVHTGNL